MKLTIVIPTYKRNASLLESVRLLLPQLSAEVELFVLDNASPVAASETLAQAAAEHPGANLQVVRNKVNVGANANILRSFELATSPWLWILGDDDIVTDTAVQDVLRCIESHPDASFINFCTEVMRNRGERPQSFDTRGQQGFVEGLDTAGNINFMSVSIWKVASVTPSLHLAYHYAYSMSHNFVLLLSALGESGRCHFSNITLIRNVTTAHAGSKWQFRDFILGWNTILELPMSARTRQTLARKMMNWHSPENVCVYFLADAAIKGKDGHDFKIVSNRLAAYVSVIQRARFTLYRALFISPAVGWSLVQRIVKAAVALNIKGINLTDIVDRSTSTAAPK